MSHTELSTDLVVVGTGMAGMAAALFAANRNISTIRVGIASESIFASGLIDLMGVHPMASGRVWDDPWAAIDALRQDLPDHPYARMSEVGIRTALDEFLAGLESAGLFYCRNIDENVQMMLPVGTIKTTYCVPASMWKGVTALKEKTPALIFGIRGLRGFSARQMTETLHRTWPDLRHAQIVFPDTEQATEVYAERLARSLSLASTRERLARIVQPHVKHARVVGFPAIFGIHDVGRIVADMAERIGRPIFEIPTMPPSIPGVRIKESLDTQLAQMGVRGLLQQRVAGVQSDNDGFVLSVGDAGVEQTIRTKAVILATGRFIGRGLTADRKRIREALFDLPVHQPGARKQWHSRDFLDPKGHAINLAGIVIDDRFRPLGKNGRPAHGRLFAAGSILAHQDWMRMKCGGGLAIATAYAAVESYLRS